MSNAAVQTRPAVFTRNRGSTCRLHIGGISAWATSADFPERARASYLGKHLFIDMSPQEIETHGKVIREVFYTLLALNKKRSAENSSLTDLANQ